MCGSTCVCMLWCLCRGPEDRRGCWSLSLHWWPHQASLVQELLGFSCLLTLIFLEYVRVGVGWWEGHYRYTVSGFIRSWGSKLVVLTGTQGKCFNHRTISLVPCLSGEASTQRWGCSSGAEQRRVCRRLLVWSSLPPFFHKRGNKHVTDTVPRVLCSNCSQV